MNKSKSFFIVKKWSYVSSILRATELGTSPEEFSQLLQTKSIRVGSSPISRDVYVSPKAKVLVFWGCNTYFPVKEESWKTVFHRNDSFLVIDKLAGLPTVPTRDNGAQNTLHYLKRKLPRELSAGPILLTTRLDTGTHGLVVFGRTPEFVGRYNKLVAAGGVDKHYQAVVVGWGNKHKNWKFPLRLQHWLSDPKKRNYSDQKPASRIEMEEATIEHFPWEESPPMRVYTSSEPTDGFPLECSLVIESAVPCPDNCLPLRPFDESTRAKIKEFSPILLTILLETGRTHQIRAQLEFEGLHIVGDSAYGCPSEIVVPNKPFGLCCVGLKFHQHDFDLRKDFKELPNE